MLQFQTETVVSISQSRGFSCQGDGSTAWHTTYADGFQSRHREAFHFRSPFWIPYKHLKQMVSISSSRGFSFQGRRAVLKTRRYPMFQSRHQDAFHFRPDAFPAPCSCPVKFQSRHREAFHFRLAECPARSCGLPVHSFNLVIERLFISGERMSRLCLVSPVVSISSSRGFSFQVFRTGRLPYQICRFNLVIERLFISGDR